MVGGTFIEFVFNGTESLRRNAMDQHIVGMGRTNGPPVEHVSETVLPRNINNRVEESSCEFAKVHLT
jgi:hypothetical protein